MNRRSFFELVGGIFAACICRGGRERPSSASTPEADGFSINGDYGIRRRNVKDVEIVEYFDRQGVYAIHFINRSEDTCQYVYSYTDTGAGPWHPPGRHFEYYMEPGQCIERLSSHESPYIVLMNNPELKYGVIPFATVFQPPGPIPEYFTGQCQRFAICDPWFRSS